jgi:hypothetical protein
MSMTKHEFLTQYVLNLVTKAGGTYAGEYAGQSFAAEAIAAWNTIEKACKKIPDGTVIPSET